jgi:hypothetical protein
VIKHGSGSTIDILVYLSDDEPVHMGSLLKPPHYYQVDFGHLHLNLARQHRLEEFKVLLIAVLASPEWVAPEVVRNQKVHAFANEPLHLGSLLFVPFTRAVLRYRMKQGQPYCWIEVVCLIIEILNAYFPNEAIVTSSHHLVDEVQPIFLRVTHRVKNPSWVKHRL